MDKGNWIRLDKRAVVFLPRDREYTALEAAFSMTLDINKGKKGTVSGYASLWGWSRNKTMRFVQDLRTGKDHMVGKRGTGNGHPIRIIDDKLQAVWGIYGTGKGQVGDSKRNTTVKTKKKKKKKKKKKPEAELGSSNFLQEKISDKTKNDIAKKIVSLQKNVKDKNFNPESFVRKNVKSGMPAELINQILDELIKYADTTDNLWAYAETILKRETGNYYSGKQLEKHNANKKEEMEAAGQVLKNIAGSLHVDRNNKKDNK